MEGSQEETKCGNEKRNINVIISAKEANMIAKIGKQVKLTSVSSIIRFIINNFGKEQDYQYLVEKATLDLAFYSKRLEEKNIASSISIIKEAKLATEKANFTEKQHKQSHIIQQLWQNLQTMSNQDYINAENQLLKNVKSEDKKNILSKVTQYKIRYKDVLLKSDNKGGKTK